MIWRLFGIFLGIWLSQEAFALEIVAFRGLHQSLRSDAEPANTECTAALVNRENHFYIENTLPSIQAAFNLGASIGHFNLRRSSDSQLVAFHDPWLQCRTNGNGLVREQPLSYLRSLDLGYRYSPEIGHYPLRGLGVGLLPTIFEILDTFPDHTFAINDKDSDAETVSLLASALKRYPQSRRRELIYIGNATGLARLQIPEMQMVLSPSEAESCISAWENSQPFPTFCREAILALPLNYIKNFSGDLARLFTDFRAHSTRIWIFEVNNETDYQFAEAFRPDAIGTYRLDHILSPIDATR